MIQMNSQMELMHRARYGGKATELLCSLSVQLSPNRHLFTNLETLQSGPLEFLWRVYFLGMID